MVLCDTGPIVAILDRRDPHHGRCAKLLKEIDGSLTTTWLCITEAMHLLGRETGWAGQQILWSLIHRGDIILHRLDHDDAERVMSDLMTAYRDTPMDVADASLILLADSLKTRRIFTIDKHFRAFRTLDGKSFDILPDGKTK